MITNRKSTDWRRILFILVAATIILSVLISACAPGLDQPGGAKGEKGKGGEKGGGGGGSGGTGSIDCDPAVEDCGTTGFKTIRHTNNSTKNDPCLDEDQLPCGNGDHGRGNPINGSLHANCRAAQGEVDPVCKEIPPVCKGPNCKPPVCEGDDCTPPACEDGACVVQRSPEPGPTCPQWIVFHSFRPGNLDIFRLDGIEGDSGANLINLSNNEFVDSRPSRSPNDQWVVYQTNRDGNVELYIADTQGASQSRLTNTDANNINSMFGPDNQNVIFQSDRNGNWDIYIVDTQTGVETQLTTNPAADVNPFWSPDPDWITFQSNRSGTWNIYLLNVSTGNEFTVTDEAYDVIFPAWSPNGEQLSYLADWGGNWDLYVSDLQGNNVQRITSQGNAGNVSWSPDGNKIAFQLGGDQITDVYTYDLTTGAQYQLTTYDGPDSAPTWDCTGSNIAFTSLSSGNLDLYSVPWQGGEINFITNNPASDKWSEWSPSKEPASRGY